MGDRNRQNTQLVNPAHAHSATLEFHLEEILRKNRIQTWLEKKWGGLLLRPRGILGLVLPVAALTAATLEDTLRGFYAMKDAEFETPNNWYSILYYGIAENPALLAWLANHINGSAD